MATGWLVMIKCMHDVALDHVVKCTVGIVYCIVVLVVLVVPVVLIVSCDYKNNIEF